MEDTQDAQGVEDTESTATEAVEETQVEGAEALGDPGKKALDAMKAKWKSEAASRKAAEEELASLKAAADGREAEHKAAQEAQKIRDEALATANDRIKKSEIRAAAKGELANPEDALVFLDLNEIEVSDDGSVDGDAVAQAIKDLLEERPYLAAQGERRFTGTVDAGPRNGGVGGVQQLTRDDLAKMSADEVIQADKNGQLNKLKGIK
ncbi:hypothetical protein [Timonella senegalensis]|uniref:hypothetical protein n=1 Tax=Timonella senegalensis TaxID=1465825 RepID=UPI002FDED87A